MKTFIVLLLAVVCVSMAFSQSAVRTENISNRYINLTGSGTDTVKVPGRVNAVSDSGTVKHLTAIIFNKIAGADSVRIFQTTWTGSSGRTIGTWVGSGSGEASFTVPIDIRIDSAYIVVVRGKAATDMTIVYRLGY